MISLVPLYIVMMRKSSYAAGTGGPVGTSDS